MRHLARVRDAGSGRWRTVDYRHLDAEELGSIYESLLELVPRHSAVDLSFELVEAAGNARKTTGSYYTPSSLIELLLDSALDPVIDDAVKRGEQAAAGAPDPSEAIVGELLALTVCDPACGSGHFLVAAARRIAKRVAAVREGNPEPTLPSVRAALHEVIARCIYGVDLNPMAVELAKVSLWLEALEPGKPLSFLDAHIQCGNALIGATPKLLIDGIPEEAFKPIIGDDGAVASDLAKRSRNAQMSLFEAGAEVDRHEHAGWRRGCAPSSRRPPTPSPTSTGRRGGTPNWRRRPSTAAPGRWPTRGAPRSCGTRPWTRRRPSPRTSSSRCRTPTTTRCRRRPTTRSSACASSTGSCTGTWRSPTSSRCPPTVPEWTWGPVGRAASLAWSATRPGSA